MGFLFGGWIVLGPYHTKFRTLSTTFETMFGLINGDDMYTTFANIETESVYIWIFSELYLYSFSCLFVYVISSLVIALIIDGYDTVKVDWDVFEIVMLFSLFRNIIQRVFRKVGCRNLVKKMFHNGLEHKIGRI